MARTSLPAVLPLFVWNEQSEIGRLEARRAELRRRIAMLRPHCHRRIELEMILRTETARQLELEAFILGRRV